MSEIKKKLDLLVENRNKIPDEFWIDGAFWFYQEDSGGYSWNAERLGINREGQVVWAFDSGCSCNSAWENFDITECKTVSHKEFVINDFLKDRTEYSELTTDEVNIQNGIDEWLLLVREDLKPEEILKANNAEVRRYLIKRVGYENIKDSVKAEVLHIDGHNELLKFNTGEMYVKVRDSSTEREYLLFVEGNHKTCRSAIAWTFGLREEEYQPEIET